MVAVKHDSYIDSHRHCNHRQSQSASALILTPASYPKHKSRCVLSFLYTMMIQWQIFHQCRVSSLSAPHNNTYHAIDMGKLPFGNRQMHAHTQTDRWTEFILVVNCFILYVMLFSLLYFYLHLICSSSPSLGQQNRWKLHEHIVVCLSLRSLSLSLDVFVCVLGKL